MGKAQFLLFHALI